MALVILPVVYPAVLAGQSNGELPDRILVSTPGLQGGATVRLVPTTTRCWRAMSGRALQDGVVLQATSYGDSYRWLALQVSTFTDRYQVEPTTNGYKLWDSDGDGTRERWYKKDGVATAAVPGTSKHGWGLAIDIKNASGTRLRWLEANAPEFGWSWETLPEEPWHIRNVTGDAIPSAVLEWEREDMEQTEKLLDSTNGWSERTVALHYGDLQKLRTMLVLAPGNAEGNPQPQPGSLLARLDAFLDTPVQPAPVDVDALAAALANNPVFLQAMTDAAFRGAQRAEDE